MGRRAAFESEPAESEPEPNEVLLSGRRKESSVSWISQFLQSYRGELALVLGTLTYAFHGVSTEALQKQAGITSLQIICVRSAIAGLLTLMLILLLYLPHGNNALKQQILAPRGKRLLLLIRALLGAIASFTNYQSIKRLPLGTSNALFYLYTFVVSVLSWPLLGERVSAVEALAVIGGIGGTVFIAQPPQLFPESDDESNSKQEAIGVILQVCTAIAFALALLCVRFLRESVSVLCLSLWFHIASTSLALILLLAGVEEAVVPPTPAISAYFLLLSVTSFGGQILVSTGYQQSQSAAVAAGLAYAEVLYSFLLGLAIFGETINMFAIIGAVLIVAAGMCASIASARSRKAKEQTSSDALEGSTKQESDMRLQTQRDGTHA